jgi:hypothetical protein
VPADEATLGDADGGEINHETDVTSEAEATRMGQSLPVDEKEVGSSSEPTEGGDQGWYLAEGEETGDVRKGDRGLDDDLFDEIEVWIGQQDDSGAG